MIHGSNDTPPTPALRAEGAILKRLDPKIGKSTFMERVHVVTLSHLFLQLDDNWLPLNK
jgi:hypothetical protein